MSWPRQSHHFLSKPGFNFERERAVAVLQAKGRCPSNPYRKWRKDKVKAWSATWKISLMSELRWPHHYLRWTVFYLWKGKRWGCPGQARWLRSTHISPDMLWASNAARAQTVSLGRCKHLTSRNGQDWSQSDRGGFVVVGRCLSQGVNGRYNSEAEWKNPVVSFNHFCN